MITDQKLAEQVGMLLGVLYEKRFAALKRLTLTRLLSKNPYLYRAIGVEDPADFIEQLLLARISSSDETLFGNDFLEPLAIWSARESSVGERQVMVGGGAGQDIAIETATAYLAISVKSGKNILNAQSNKGQSAEFAALQARLKKLNKQFRAIIGYGYGRRLAKTEEVVEKVAGQAFWAMLTGEQDYYLRIVQSMKIHASGHGAAYREALLAKKNQLLRAFLLNFVDVAGKVRWDQLVVFNSAAERPKRLRLVEEAGACAS